MVGVQIQYLGFQLKRRGRDYLYLVVDPKAESREFTFTIPNQQFVAKGIPYQDAAGLCYQKLRKGLELEVPDTPLPRHATLSDQELEEYLAKYRPPKRRAW
ncbi:MAG TPA: hypothetical protein VFM21_02100 [Terriglobia bacterium]|nr:hypothetical protein [Terriglobia bacterium]